MSQSDLPVCAQAGRAGEEPVLSAALPPKEAEKRVHTLDRQEVSYLIEQLRERDPLYADLAHVAVETGVRVGELLALKPADVDFAQSIVRVERAWSGVGKDRELGVPKSGKARSVPLPRSLVPVLQRRIELVGSRADSLWVGPRGGSLRHANVLARSNFKAIVRDIGHPDFRWHDLRATAIVGWIRVGIPLATVRDWAGHASLTTTDRYVRVARNDHAAAVRLLDEMQ